MGARFTVRLDDSNAEWVDTESDDRDRPKAWVINEAIRAARGAESTYSHRDGDESTAPVRTDAHLDSDESTDAHHDDLRERVAELEERVDRLEDESTTAEPEPTPDPMGRGEPVHGGARDVESERDTTDGPTPGDDIHVPSGDLDADLLDGLRDYLADRPPEKTHGKRAALETVLVLREHGTMSTGDLQDAVYAEVEEHYADSRTMWSSIDRYLDDVPGVAKAGYGKWDFAGDDEIRDAVTG
jgi:hypothetical protein